MTLTALIVDDSRMIRMLAAQILEDEGFETLEAPDGSQGLDMLRKRPDVIISDLNMPRMNGVTFVKAVRADLRSTDTPLVMISGDNDDGKRSLAMEAGVDAWLAKPFGPKELLTAVGEAMLLRSGPWRRRNAARVVDAAANW